MSRDPKTPQDSLTPPGPAGASVSGGPSDASAHAGRRAYAAPRLKRLGSVRDLTLGSPALPFNDLMGGRQRAPM